MGKNRQKFWITKWWQTKGIQEVECEVTQSGLYAHERSLGLFLPIGLDAFDNEDDAKKRVRELSERRIKMLQRQIGRIEKLRAELLGAT